MIYTAMTEPALAAATKLQQYMCRHHWTGQALVGPDPGIRINYRLGRFVKSYLPQIAWRDAYYYLQAQGYWVLSLWQLSLHHDEANCRDMAIRCSAHMLEQQREDGSWLYPNREWKGRVATAEGTWAALGLLETYRQTGEQRFLDGVLRWHTYLTHEIDFERVGEAWSVRYFAGVQDGRVPNNSVFVLRFLAKLAEVTRDRALAQPCDGLLTFIQDVQAPSGEFPYVVTNNSTTKGTMHFQCYQYNAFQCLDLMHYVDASADTRAVPLIRRVLGFLRQGLAMDGHVHYACGNPYRAVTYHTAAVAAACWRAQHYGIAGFDDLAHRAYGFILQAQQPQGGFAYSWGDYRLLKDQRAYPRYLAMILYHLMICHPMYSHRKDR